MKRATVHPLQLHLVAGLAAACGLAMAQDSPPARASSAIGVVDFTKVIATYPRAIQERKRLDDSFKERQASLEGDERKAQETRQQRDLFQKDSSEWRFKDLELRLAVQALEGKRAIFQEELRQQREQFYVNMLEDMQQAVAIVAKERGVALVLRTHNDLLDGSTESKARVFEARVVWYASEEVDLTPAVIKLLQVPLPKPTEAAGSSRSDGPSKDQAAATENHGSQQGRK
jgi:Skp family chaperone for outer membrane proteins